MFNIEFSSIDSYDHISESFLKTDISAIALASILHYNLFTFQEIKNHLTQVGIKTRQ